MQIINPDKLQMAGAPLRATVRNGGGMPTSAHEQPLALLWPPCLLAVHPGMHVVVKRVALRKRSWAPGHIAA
jgi:hypothetical protein